MSASANAEERFDVAVWNHEGDIVHAFWGVSADEVDEIQARFEDDPMLSVVVTER